MLRTLYGDDERYKAAYWSEIPGCYFTGDGARRDEHGNYWIMGRVDDVLNVAGHRLSTMEIESALVSHPKVAEAAVVGKPDELQGPGDRRVRHARIGPGSQRGSCARSCAPTSSRRSAPWPAPTTSGSPTPCPRPAAARSCDGCSATSPPAARAPATPRPSKTSTSWPSCEETRKGRIDDRAGPDRARSMPGGHQLGPRPRWSSRSVLRRR